jgi:hypothetical protein
MRSLQVFAAVIVWLSTTSLFATQFSFTAQTRKLDASAHAETFGSVPADDVKTLSAADFSDFNQSLSASAIATKFDGTPSSKGDSNVAQNSHLGGSVIGATGSVSASTAGTVSPPMNYATVSGGSSFSVTFTLPEAADVQLIYQLFVQRFLPAFAANANVTTTFSLAGGSTNLTAAAALVPAETTKTVPFNEVLSLAAGTYTLSLTSSGNAATHSLGFFTDGSFNGTYSVSLEIVPEPSSLALLLIGAFGFCQLRPVFCRARI